MFGVTGDLARKKLMPAVYDLANRGLLPPAFALTGFARRDWDGEDFAKVVHDSVKKYARTPFREETWKQLAEGIRFVQGTFDDPAAFAELRATVEELDQQRGTGRQPRVLPVDPAVGLPAGGQASCATPASPTPRRARGAASSSRSRLATTSSPPTRSTPSCPRSSPLTPCSASTTTWARRRCRTCWPCASPTSSSSPSGTRNTSTTCRSPWPRTSASAARAGYYDGIGAARDVIQNHLLQLFALTAMEEPASFDAADLRTEKEKVLRAVALARRPGCGHRAGPVRRGLARRRAGGRLPRRGRHCADSITETYAAIRLDIPNRRWAGTPFYLRAGKRLGRRVTEIALVFKKAPMPYFQQIEGSDVGTNALVIRVQPDEGVTLKFGSKVPGTAMEVRDVTMDFAYGNAFTETSPEAYERLILDVLLGDPPLFPRHEEVASVVADPGSHHRLLGHSGTTGAVPLGHVGTRECG